MFSQRIMKFFSISDNITIKPSTTRIHSLTTLVCCEQTIPFILKSHCPPGGQISRSKCRMLSKLVLHQHESDESKISTCNYNGRTFELNAIDAIRKHYEKSYFDIIKKKPSDAYLKAMQDLNFLQSNTKTVALAKYSAPEQILPIFAKQLNLSGINIDDLNKLNIIHISGTKGKGSTCAFLESILRAAGKRTGFYNSPHLVKVTERIRLNGDPISEDKFTTYFNQIYNRLLIGTKREGITMPNYFSFLTILAFHIFLEEKVDVAVIEVGIGGEYDTTNIVKNPVACGITTLDFDHTNILGSTIEKIAWSKSGIAKKDVPLFSIEQEHTNALEVFKTRAAEKACPLYICKPLANLPKDVELGIRGSAQLANASLACQLASYFLKVTSQQVNHSPDISQNSYLETNLSELPPYFRRALESCTWPGRCHIVRYPRITFFLDGAHTKKSMENCLDWFLTQSTSKSRKILMVNIIGARNKFEVLRPLSQFKSFELAIFSTNRIDFSIDDPTSDGFVNLQSSTNDKSMENARANADTWQSLLEEHGGGDSKNILIRANTIDSIKYIDGLTKMNCDNKFDVLVTGSLHFVGAILQTLTIVDDTLNRDDQ